MYQPSELGQGWRPIATVMGLFFVAMLPFASAYLWHHPDERHYTDAATQMIQRADYWTPRTADGQLRFHKPYLAYWLVAASYRGFGVSAASSRIPFLLVACGVIGLTAGMARLISRAPHAPLLAAAIVACHPVLILSATRSIPDILLCASLLLSVWGFLRITAFGSGSPRAYWAAYLGAGFGVAAKGLPALAFLLFAWGFALFNPWQRVAWRRLLHIPSMIVGGVVGFWWFVAMHALHGSAAMQGFLADQATQRVIANPWQSVRQFLLFFALCLVPLAVWCLPLAMPSVVRRWLQHLDDQQRQAYRFLLGWLIVFAGLACHVQDLSVRYTLPMAPLLAVTVADMMGRIHPSNLRSWLRVLLVIALGTSFLVLIAGTTGSYQGLPRREDWVPMALLIGTAVALWRVGWRGSMVENAVCLPSAVVLVMLAALVSVRHWALPDQGTQIAQSLAQLFPSYDRPVPLLAKPALASKVRVAAQGRAAVERIRFKDWHTVRSAEVLVVPEELAADLDPKTYRFYRSSQGFRDLSPWGVLASILSGNLPRFLQERRDAFLVAVRHEPTEVQQVSHDGQPPAGPSRLTRRVAP